jgi:putative ABC transport system substrate-binding protein
MTLTRRAIVIGILLLALFAVPLATAAQRILLGANPGEPPVEQVDRFHFAIDLRTAKALGLAIPPSVRVRAVEIIDQ